MALKAALAIAVIAVLAVAGYFVFRPSSTVEVPILAVHGVPDSNVLIVFSGDCLSPWHIDVEESEESITITVAVDRHDNIECPDILEHRDIHLAQALGEREVIDGYQNLAVAVTGPEPPPYEVWLCGTLGYCESPSR